MARELARAKESTTSPKSAKDRLGDERRSTAVGRLVLAIAIRGLWPASSGQGLQLTLACRRAVSATTIRGDNPARLMRCPEAARLKWTVWDQVRLRNCRPIRDRKGPGAIRSADVPSDSAQAAPEARSHGDPVQERRRPGGSATAVMGRGRKHT